jgi:PAS domain S-box-containing protein
MNGSYNPLLVALSVLVAIFASYTALDLANSVTVARGRARLVWLSAGALAMGLGIWSMHFVGMLAFGMPGMPIAYDIPLLILSVVVAVLASALALFVVSRRTVALPALILSALAMGAAIAGMHYIGMWSMRMPATIDWNPGLVTASILIAVAASFVALSLAFRYRTDRSDRAKRIRIGGGVVMGFAIAGMHYTAMAAAWFVPRAGQMPLHERDVLATDGLGIAVTGTTLLILAVAVAGSAISREMARRMALAEEDARLYRAAEAARREAEELAEELQNQATELEALNDELITVEGRLRAVVDSALDAMIVADANSIILEWNRHAEIVFGWSAEEAIGTNLSETIIPPQHRETHRKGMERYLATGTGPILNRRIEITALRRDGHEFPVELAVAPVRAGGQTLFTAFLRDITERKRSEDRERELIREQTARVEAEAAERRISEILESITGSFLAFDHEWRVTYANSRAEELMRARREDLLGENLWDLYPQLRDTAVYEAFQRAMSERVALDLDHPSRLRAGAWLHFHIAPTSGGVAAYVRDVTEIKRAEEALRAATKEAERANRTKSEFLSRMSHELRTPLNAILGFGQLLELDVEAEEDQESVEQILKAGKHLLGLVDEVLDIARIEEGQMSISVEPVSVQSVLQASVDLVRLTAAKQGITLRAQDALASEHFVWADQKRLEQVLLNLLSNAIKYNRGEGTVTLSCEEVAESRLRIGVADTGYGIPAGKLERLFTPFDRLGAEQAEVEGTGLGLALSKGLVEAMGGKLGVESMEGEGSRFWVELPLAPPPIMTEPAPARRPEVEAPGRSETGEITHIVLFVEDNLANVRLMERIFRRRPQVRLLTAMQGSLGLELAREHLPDLILLDLNLPDLSGDKVLLQLRQDSTLREIPVVMISGDATPSQVQRMLDLGAQGYMTKPFDVQELLDLVDSSLQPQEDQ